MFLGIRRFAVVLLVALSTMGSTFAATPAPPSVAGEGIGVTVWTPAAGDGGPSGVMLQGFYWNVPCPGLDRSSTWWWDRLAMESGEIASSGFTAVWLPPMLKSWGGGRGLTSCGYDPYDDYDLGDKNQVGTVPTRYGNREQLERCCAMLRADGVDVYADLVDNHRDPDDRPAHFQYVDAYGNPTGGRFSKEPKDFHINIPQDPDVPAGSSEIHFGRDLAPINGRTVDVDGKPVVWSDYGLRQAGDWMTRALDLGGYRIDDVYGISWDWLNTFLSTGAMQGKFAVGEYYTGDVSAIEGWIKHLNGRASAFDFPLRDNYLVKMCNTPDDFDMSTLQGAGLAGIDPAHAVTFVENHDSDRNEPILQNKMLAYAYILTSPGYPCVYYRDWSLDLGCYGFAMHDAIDRLVHIREALATGGVDVRHKDKRTYVYERTGGRGLLVGLSDDPDKPRTITCATGFGPGVALHDYTGHGADVTTDAQGDVTIVIPVDDDGGGYVAYAPSGIDIDPATAAPTQTVQTYEGAQDLDIKPADDREFVTVCRIDAAAGKPISGALTFGTRGWTAKTSIVLRLDGPGGSSEKTYTLSTAQGDTFDATAASEGWYTFTIRSFNTPVSNERPSYKLTVKYTAPSTSTGVTPPPAFKIDRDADGNVKSIALTDENSGASIYYTTDGSIPTSNSTRYAGPIVFDGSPRVVAAFALAPGLRPSPAVADGYAVTTVPITFRISGVPIQPGQKLYAVGNQSALGMWTISSAPALIRVGDSLASRGPTVRLADSTSGLGTRTADLSDEQWSVTVNLPVDTSVNYKYVLYDGHTEIWEQSQSTSSTNREFNTPLYGAVTRRDGVFLPGGVKGAGAASCPVTFAVKCADATAQSVFVVGSQPGLGNWDASQGFALTRGADNVWQGTVNLAPRIPIQYKYVCWSGNSPLWEGDQPTPSKNREFMTPPSGGIDRDDGLFGSSAGGVCTCRFAIANTHATAGQTVYVVGNVPVLGNWSPAQGFALKNDNGLWTGSVDLPAGFVVEYKYVLFDGKTSVWEQDQPTASGNRQFKSPSTATANRTDGDFNG